MTEYLKRFWDYLSQNFPKQSDSEPEWQRRWIAYRRDLIVQWNLLPDDCKRPEVLSSNYGLPQKSKLHFDWSRLFEAELKLVQSMTKSAIEAEFARRYAEAESIGLYSARQLNDNYQRNNEIEWRRDILLRLLDDLHQQYEDRALALEVRDSTVKTINALGWLIWVVILLAVAHFAGQSQMKGYPALSWLLPIFAGMNGAYFSRLIEFQAQAEKLDYKTLKANFSFSALVSRVLAGMIGSILIFIVIQSGLFGGEFFPSLRETNGSTWWDAVVVTKSGAVPVYLNVPGREFSGLLFWCTLAGFSERLLPDQFARLSPKKS